MYFSQAKSFLEDFNWCYVNEKQPLKIKIGSLSCVKYIEKKPNLTILTSIIYQIFFINHDSQHSMLFQKKILARPLELLALN